MFYLLLSEDLYLSFLKGSEKFFVKSFIKVLKLQSWAGNQVCAFFCLHPGHPWCKWLWTKSFKLALLNITSLSFLISRSLAGWNSETILMESMPHSYILWLGGYILCMGGVMGCYIISWELHIFWNVPS